MREDTYPSQQQPATLRSEDFPSWFRIFALQRKSSPLVLICACVILATAGLCYLMVDQTTALPSRMEAQYATEHLDSESLDSESLDPMAMAGWLDRADEDGSHEELQKRSDQKRSGEAVAMQAFGEMSSGMSPELMAVASAASAGRPDPFEPLFGQMSPNATVDERIEEITITAPPVEQDVMDDVEYIGMIHDKKSDSAVAMIRVNDPYTGRKTLIKKLKEAFLLDGRKLYVKSIDRYQVGLWVDGKMRYKSLNPYADMPGSGSSFAASSMSGGGYGENTPPTISAKESEILKALQDQ
jgi:hypothetical protein